MRGPTAVPTNPNLMTTQQVMAELGMKNRRTFTTRILPRLETVPGMPNRILRRSFERLIGIGDNQPEPSKRPQLRALPAREG